MRIKDKFSFYKIEQAIADFEKHVDFELVPVIAEKSTPTDHVKWILTVLIGMFAFIFVEAIHLFEIYDFTISEVIYVWGASLVLGFALSTLLSGSSLIQRFFTFEKLRRNHVDLKAQQVFFQKRLYDTETHQGLLLFISLMEKRIVILPDPKSQYSGTQVLTSEILRILQQAFKHHHYEQGFLDAIEFMKKELIQHFPMEDGKNQVNELPNKLIWWDE